MSLLADKKGLYVGAHFLIERKIPVFHTNAEVSLTALSLLLGSDSDGTEVAEDYSTVAVHDKTCLSVSPENIVLRKWKGPMLTEHGL